MRRTVANQNQKRGGAAVQAGKLDNIIPGYAGDCLYSGGGGFWDKGAGGSLRRR